MELNGILSRFSFGPDAAAEPFRSEEDGAAYAVWKITTDQGVFVLKKAKEYESQVYATFLQGQTGFAPELRRSQEIEGTTWLLMEYVEGEDLRFCTRQKLTKVLDALIAMQDVWWGVSHLDGACYSMELARPGRIRRGEDLGNETLQRGYGEYLACWESIPRTLCHEDLLPFNVLINEKRAALIDWEYGGIQPYLSSLARLIAHGEEEEDAFFHMKEADKAFAIDYYYRNLVAKKGISYLEYRRCLDAFLLYEYCEWVMLGVRYGNTQSERYKRYLNLALNHIENTFKEET